MFGSFYIPFHIVQGATGIQVIPLAYDDGLNPLGLKFRRESLGALAAEKGFAAIIHLRVLHFHVRLWADFIMDARERQGGTVCFYGELKHNFAELF